MSTFAILANVFAGVGGLTGIMALLMVGPQRRKSAAETEKINADAAEVIRTNAVALLEPTREQVLYLSNSLTATQARADALDAQVRTLTLQLREANDELAAYRKRGI